MELRLEVNKMKDFSNAIKQGVSDKVKQELEDPELFTTKVAQYDTFENAMYDLGIFEPEFIKEYYSKQQENSYGEENSFKPSPCSR